MLIDIAKQASASTGKLWLLVDIVKLKDLNIVTLSVGCIPSRDAASLGLQAGGEGIRCIDANYDEECLNFHIKSTRGFMTANILPTRDLCKSCKLGIV